MTRPTSLTDHSRFTWLQGFIPGRHCTEICHHTAGELVDLPPTLHRDLRNRPLYCCDACYPRVFAGLKRSEAAFRGVATRRRNGGKRAPR